MAINFDYSRAARPVSPRLPVFRSVFSPLLPVLLAAAALWAALPAAAQYVGQVNVAPKNGPDLRAVAVLEWTGEPGHPKASRIVPITVWDGQNLQDASIYMSRPEPMALDAEVEYQLKQDGKTIGLYDIESAAQQQGEWYGIGKWKSLPVARPAPPPKQFARDNFGGDDDSGPVLHRKAHSGDSSSSGKSGSGSNAPAPDPDRPTLHRTDSSGGSSGDSSGTGSSAGAPAPDPDQPTLHRASSDDSPAANAPPRDPDRPILKEPAKQTAPSKPQSTNDVAYSEALPAITDPNRPRLTRGKPTDEGPSVLPTLVGLPPDMNQTIAVSDAVNHPDHPWNFTWANPGDADKMKADLEEIARKDLGLVPPPPPAAPKRTTSHKKAKPAPPPPPPAPLLDEQFRVFELTYGSGATMVFSAHTQGTGAQQKFVTLIAQPDLYGNVTVLLKNVTDAAHLDDTPRMKLIDPVDAMADNRGELLFELRAAGQRQFVLYRVLRGQVQKLFTSAPAPYAG